MTVAPATRESATRLNLRIARILKNDPRADVTELRAQYRAQKLAEYVEKVLADVPPLKPEDRQRIARLLMRGAA
ncbi:hypothetical protein ABT304_05785 [Nocardioides sp. NPDC000445]|uniref:hypothetical protein n=1 Tax=Nocardioides sp. NPDC000445 TaxID=3154257 RepID=UPI00331C018A